MLDCDVRFDDELKAPSHIIIYTGETDNEDFDFLYELRASIARHEQELIPHRKLKTDDRDFPKFMKEEIRDTQKHLRACNYVISSALGELGRKDIPLELEKHARNILRSLETKTNPWVRRMIENDR